jgi:hypothetical protein
MIPLVTFGVLAICYGAGVYYLLPLSLLSFNASMLLTIFFLILMGMIVGLSILAFNLQSICEIAITYIFLFWERTVMRRLLSKNLVAHKRRNKLTAIIYTLTLACVIFLVTALNLELDYIENYHQTTPTEDDYFDYDFVIDKSTWWMGDTDLCIDPVIVDPVLISYGDFVSEFSYMTSELDYQFEG